MLSWQAKLCRFTLPLFLAFYFYKIQFKAKSGKNDWLFYLRQEIEKFAIPPKRVLTQQITTDKINGLLVKFKSEKSNKIILFLHGGAYILGTPKLYTELAYLISQAAKSDVFILDYKLAPEYPFPSAIDDAINAYEYFLSIGYNPQNIIIAGDSAGGGLTGALLISLRDKKIPLPKCAIFIAPFFDFTFSGKSIEKNSKKDYILRITDEAKADMIKMYLKDVDPKNPLASPLFADLTGLPPMLIHVGGDDVLLDDALRFAEKAKNAHVNITLEVWDEMPHDFHMLARFLPEAKQAIQLIGKYIQSVN